MSGFEKSSSLEQQSDGPIDDALRRQLYAQLNERTAGGKKQSDAGDGPERKPTMDNLMHQLAEARKYAHPERGQIVAGSQAHSQATHHYEEAIRIAGSLAVKPELLLDAYKWVGEDSLRGRNSPEQTNLAVQYFNKALEIEKLKPPGEKGPEYAHTMELSAMAYQKLDTRAGHGEAVRRFAMARSLRDENNLPESRDSVLALQGLGDSYFHLNGASSPEARRAYERALKIVDQLPGEKTLLVQCLDVFAKLPASQASRENLERALLIREQSQNASSFEIASRHDVLASQNLGSKDADLAKAKLHEDKALAFWNAPLKETREKEGDKLEPGRERDWCYREAINERQRELTQLGSAGAGMTPRAALCLSNLGELYLKLGDIDKAEVHFSNSLGARRNYFEGQGLALHDALAGIPANGQTTTPYAQVLLDEMGTLRGLVACSKAREKANPDRDLTAAVPYLDRIIQLERFNLIKQGKFADKQLAQDLDELGRRYASEYERTDNPEYGFETQRFLRESAQIDRELGIEDANTVSKLMLCGKAAGCGRWLAGADGKDLYARDYLWQALELQSRLSGRDSVELLPVLDQIDSFGTSGQKVQANERALAIERAEIRRTGKEDPSTIPSRLGKLGRAYKENGQSEQARTFSEMLAIGEKRGEANEVVVDALRGLAHVAGSEPNQDLELSYLLRKQRVLERLDGLDPSEEQEMTLKAIGDLQLDLKKNGDAIETFKKMLTVGEKLTGKRSAAALYDLATAYERTGATERALEVGEESFSIMAETAFPNKENAEMLETRYKHLRKLMEEEKTVPQTERQRRLDLKLENLRRRMVTEGERGLVG